jgi:hypothetical protein
MALPASGQITLNQIHVEAGGSSGTQASINDSDIRSLIGAVSGQSNLSFSSFYGASAGWSTTMTVGSQTIKGSTTKGYSPLYGSLSSSTFGVSGIYNGFLVANLNQGGSGAVSFSITHNTGTAKSNSGWSTVKINGVTLSRSAASFANNSNESFWGWSGVSLNFIYNNANGTTELVEFT